WEGSGDDPRPVDRSLRWPTDARWHPQAPDRAHAGLWTLDAEDRLHPRPRQACAGWQGGFRVDAADVRCRGDRYTHAGERRGRVDRTDVPDVRAEAGERAADRRLRSAERDPARIQQTQESHRETRREDRKSVASLLQHRQLVSMAQPRGTCRDL